MQWHAGHAFSRHLQSNLRPGKEFYFILTGSGWWSFYQARTVLMAMFMVDEKRDVPPSYYQGLRLLIGLVQSIGR